MFATAFAEQLRSWRALWLPLPCLLMGKTKTAVSGATKTAGTSKTAARAAPPSVEAVAAEVLALLSQIEQKLEALDLAQLTVDERAASAGKLREGETEALSALLDVVDASPRTFAALADKDRGNDPQHVETTPSRQALARRQALAPVAEALARLQRRVDDDVLLQGDRVREVTTPAYALLKANAPVDAKVRKLGARVFDFYASLRKARKKAPQ